jgi:hypothetical protein
VPSVLNNRLSVTLKFDCSSLISLADRTAL